MEALDISLGEQTAEQKLEVTAQAGQFAPDIVKASKPLAQNPPVTVDCQQSYLLTAGMGTVLILSFVPSGSIA